MWILQHHPGAGKKHVVLKLHPEEVASGDSFVDFCSAAFLSCQFRWWVDGRQKTTGTNPCAGKNKKTTPLAAGRQQIRDESFVNLYFKLFLNRKVLENRYDFMRPERLVDVDPALDSKRIFWTYRSQSRHPNTGWLLLPSKVGEGGLVCLGAPGSKKS